MASEAFLTYDNAMLLSRLLGNNDEHVGILEENLHVTIACRGNVVSVTGKQNQTDKARKVLDYLYHRLEEGFDVSENDIEQAITMATNRPDKGKSGSEMFDEEPVISTFRKHIVPRSNNQRRFVETLRKHDLSFASGPAGTGKTYLAVGVGVQMFMEQRVERIILARPAVEAGEKIGFLPGDMREKLDPYMQPLYDALHDMMPEAKVKRYIEERIIEVAPLAFMRGRTLKNAFVILDEAQNTNCAQMKMFLTRLGEGSRMVINGDLTQVDLPSSTKSGFADAIDRLKDHEKIGHVRFNERDVIRHPLVSAIVQAYEL